MRDPEKRRIERRRHVEKYYIGLPRVHARPQLGNPGVDPKRFAEACEAYAKRSAIEELLGDPPAGRSALDRRTR